MLNKVLATLVILICSKPAAAMDLMDLYREAKANDARYAAAKAQFRVMQERVPQAQAGVAPQSGFNASKQTVRGRLNAGLPSSHLQRSH